MRVMVEECVNVLLVAYFLWLAPRPATRPGRWHFQAFSLYCLPCIAEAFVVQINSIPQFLIENSPMLDHPNRQSIFRFTSKKTVHLPQALSPRHMTSGFLPLQSCV